MRKHVRIAIDGGTVRIARWMRELHEASQSSATIRDERTHVATWRAITERALNRARAFIQIVICASTANPVVESAAGRTSARLRKDSLAQIAKPAKKNQRFNVQSFTVRSFPIDFSPLAILAILAIWAREIFFFRTHHQAQNERVNFDVAPCVVPLAVNWPE